MSSELQIAADGGEMSPSTLWPQLRTFGLVLAVWLISAIIVGGANLFLHLAAADVIWAWLALSLTIWLALHLNLSRRHPTV